MKKSRLTLTLALALFTTLATFNLAAQYVPPSPAQNIGAVAAAAGPAGLVATVSGLTVSVTPGPMYCGGDIALIHNTQFTLQPNQTYFVAYGCLYDQLYVRTGASVQGPDILLATVVTGASSVSTITDLRVAALFPNQSDGIFFVPASQCGGTITGTAGAGNATEILALSGGLRVFRLSNTNAGASINVFTCHFNVPSRLTTGKGAQLLDIVLPVSTQTTQPTSVILPTLKSFTPPLPVDPETASSATFVAFGGTITFSPTTGQFAGYSAVAAGQFYTVKATLGTPTFVNNDLQTFVVTFQFNQAAAAAGVQEIPGFYVHYLTIPN